MRWLWLIPLFLLGLVVYFPASVAINFMPQSIAQQLQIRDASGTIWSGRAAQVQAELPSGATLRLQNLSWQLSGVKLLTGTLKLNFEIPQAGNPLSGTGTIVATQKGLTLLSGQLQGNIAATTKLLELPVPLTLDGTWRLNLRDFSLAKWQPLVWCDTLDAQLNGDAIQVRLQNQWHALGDYTSKLNCTEQQTVAITIPNNNVMRLAVNAKLNGTPEAPRISINGSMQPTLEAPKAVTDLLVFVGKPNAQGVYQFGINL